MKSDVHRPEEEFALLIASVLLSHSRIKSSVMCCKGRCGNRDLCSSIMFMARSCMYQFDCGIGRNVMEKLVVYVFEM